MPEATTDRYEPYELAERSKRKRVQRLMRLMGSRIDAQAGNRRPAQIPREIRDEFQRGLASLILEGIEWASSGPMTARPI